jgi:hypothetical protein
MISQDMDNLVRIGLLKKELGSQPEFDGLVELARTRLGDAKMSGLSASSCFALAYDAAHAFSLAALRWHGYRPDNRRYIVFQCLEYTLGLRLDDRRILEKCHNLRNIAEYEGRFNVGAQLLSDLLRVTESIGQSVDKLGPLPTKRA